MRGENYRQPPGDFGQRLDDSSECRHVINIRRAMQSPGLMQRVE
jgi:hypothetical protein